MDNTNDVERTEFNERKSVYLYTKFFKHETSLDLVSVFFALILIVLGMIGYFESNSKVSLLASIGIAIPILISSYFIPKNLNWSYLSCGATIILFGAMITRYFKNFNFWPSGLVSLLSIIFLIFLNVRLILTCKQM